MSINEECIATLSCISSKGSSSVVSLFMPLSDDRTGAWNLIIEESSYDKPPTKRRRSIGAGYCKHLLQQLTHARIPAVFNEILGCDGAHFELTLYQGFNHTTYHWWSELPAGFEPVMQFCNELLGVARADWRVTMLQELDSI